MPLLPTHRRRAGDVSRWRDPNFLEDQMGRMMSALPGWAPLAEALHGSPRVDFADEDGVFVLTAELPGVEPDDVDIEVEGNVLSIRGEKRVEHEQKGDHVHVAERHYGSFERTFTLPSSADPEKITADFHQGVLKLRIEKRPESRGKKIQVESK
jgi:HSP20 family protein